MKLLLSPSLFLTSFPLFFHSLDAAPAAVPAPPSPGTEPSQGALDKQRKRLSIFRGNAKPQALDGDSRQGPALIDPADYKQEDSDSEDDTIYDTSPFSSVLSLSKTGYVPFNQGKVNQDRALVAVNLLRDPTRALFGLFLSTAFLSAHLATVCAGSCF